METRPDSATDLDPQTVEREVIVATDLHEAWELLTTPDDLAGWLGAEVVFDPRPGSTGEVVDHDGTRRRLVVDEVEHESRISWRWWVDGGADASLVEITLSPAVDGTRIAVVERPIPGTGPVTASAAVRTTAAWSHRLLHLELLVLLAATSLRV